MITIKSFQPYVSKTSNKEMIRFVLSDGTIIHRSKKQVDCVLQKFGAKSLIFLQNADVTDVSFFQKDELLANKEACTKSDVISKSLDFVPSKDFLNILVAAEAGLSAVQL